LPRGGVICCSSPQHPQAFVSFKKIPWGKWSGLYTYPQLPPACLNYWPGLAGQVLGPAPIFLMSTRYRPLPLGKNLPGNMSPWVFQLF
jgi:hypothetical protein